MKAKFTTFEYKLFPLENLIPSEFNEVDPKKKTYPWANKVIGYLRMQAKPLNNWIRAGHNRMMEFSMQSIQRVKDSFDDEDFKNSVKFQPLPILEPLLNAVVEEIIKNPPRAELRATDPSSEHLRKQDQSMLQTRKMLENDRTALQARVGDPPYKVPDEMFGSNVDEFDKMGLDENDPDDMSFYGSSLQKLKFEIAGQSILNNVLKYNQFDEITVRKLVKDIFALKTVCTQTYVDEITGAIRYKYIDPATCYGIFGHTNDGKDDICRGWDQSVTVADWLSMVGEDFDFGRDWKMLLWGINYCSNQRFTGFIRNGLQFNCFGTDLQLEMGLGDVTEPSFLDWSQAYMFNVYVGYIEWSSWDATRTILKSPLGVNKLVPYEYELSKKEVRESYAKESRYNQQWYRSYYIATTAISQWVYGFQKIYHQHIEGANDEYSNGTLCYYQEEGLAPVEIAQPYLEMANFAYYRMLWIIYKAKPDADEFVWEELVQLAQNTKAMLPQNNSNTDINSMSNVIMDIIKQMRTKHVRIRTFVKPDGRTAMPIMPIDKHGSGGLDPLAIAMQAITQWAENQIAIKIGINPARIGQADPNTEGYKLTVMQTQYSMSTTGYIYRMVQYLKLHMATVTLNYTQDIIKFKDSLPYKWILNMIGDAAMTDLKLLDNFAAHRMGIFFGDYNTEADRQKIEQAATIDLQNGNIDITQWYLVTQQQDTKRAFQLLAHYKLTQEKKKRQDIQQAQQAQQQLSAQNFQQEMQLEKVKGDYGNQRETIKANGFVASAQLNSQTHIHVQDLKNAAEVGRVAAETEKDKSVIQEQANVDAQKPTALTS